jgi:hypothetical protein
MENTLEKSGAKSQLTLVAGPPFACSGVHAEMSM